MAPGMCVSPSTLMTVATLSLIEVQVSPGVATYTSLQKAMLSPVHTALPGCTPTESHSTSGFSAVNLSMVIPA